MPRSTPKNIAGIAGTAARKVIGRTKAEPAVAAVAPVKSTAAAAKKAAAPAKKAASTAKKAASSATKATAPAKKAATTAKKSASAATKKATAPAKKAASTATKKAATSAVKATAPAKKAASSAVKATAPAKKAASSAVKKAVPARKGPVKPETLPFKEGEEAWTKAELNEVIADLNDHAARLREELREQEAELAGLLKDAGDGAGHDQADMGATSFERDHELTVVNNSREMLAQTERALARIADGSYGVCESCGQAIGKLRVMAFPRATLCMDCKKREERR
jgi:RNA polymerase-binding protein DksA